jgi:hypothetical protein
MAAQEQIVPNAMDRQREQLSVAAEEASAALSEEDLEDDPSFVVEKLGSSSEESVDEGEDEEGEGGTSLHVHAE